jgi:hypothetical protein
MNPTRKTGRLGRGLVGGFKKIADRDYAEGFAVGGGEDGGEGLDGAGWVSDAVVQDDDGAGD